jgi:predicted acyl esterase
MPMNAMPFHYRFRAPLNTPQSRGAGAPHYRRSIEHGMIVERDVAVALRDGVRIFVDVYRPPDEQPAAPLIAWGPYGKHTPNEPERFPYAGLNPEHMSSITPFEGPDPVYWVPRGYAVVTVNKRGTWYPEGEATYLSPEEARDFYDVIEWAGVQPWSTGKVGLTGVSYLASSQWRVAELQPPHLAAINPWEGWADTYREVAYHGGIPDTWFWPYLWSRWGASSTRIEDWRTEMHEHPIFDAFWASKAADFSRIETPAFVVASWSDQGLHTRGTLEGFKHIASPHKWLEVHGRKKWAYYYEPASVARLQTFFDHFLKGRPTAISRWPKVRLEIRDRAYVGVMRAEHEWPLARTQYTKLHLDAVAGALRTQPVDAPGQCRYEAVCGLPDSDHAAFDVTFAEPTELTGHMKLRLFMSAEGADDLDVFVGLQKLDAQGAVVHFPFYAQFDNGPVALGWLRASHRELDAQRSTEHQPVLAHGRVQKLEPSAVVQLEIEIWPSSTRFDSGEGLRLIVQGSDINKYSKTWAPVYFRHEESVNRGLHVLHTGGDCDSHLLVPLIPR